MVSGPVKDRARRHRRSKATPCAHEPTIAKSPTRRVCADRADEAPGPAKPFEVIQATRIGRKPSLEFTH